MTESRLTLRQWRLAREKTIAEMAEVCGVHPNTYAAWEDDPKVISIRNAEKICDFLGLSINDLFFRSE